MSAAMSGGRSTVVDVTYDDPRTGERVRERRIQEVPDDEIENVRRRELAMVLPSRQAQEDYYNERRDDYYRDRSRGRRDYNYLAPEQHRPQRARSYRGDEVRRRNSSSSSSSESDLEEDRRSRRRDGRRRARSARAANDRDAESDDEGVLWWSHRPRKDANFFERNFDSSYDGLLTAAAGAAIGAMTARRFAHKEGDEKMSKNWKTIGGAFVGAAAFNAAENRYRVYTEEKIEKKKEEEGVI